MASGQTSRHPAGDRLLRAGAVVTVICLICTLIAMLPLIIPDLTLPSAWWFLSMIAGLGLGLILIGLIITARSRRRSTHS